MGASSELSKSTVDPLHSALPLHITAYPLMDNRSVQTRAYMKRMSLEGRNKRGTVHAVMIIEHSRRTWGYCQIFRVLGVQAPHEYFKHEILFV